MPPSLQLHWQPSLRASVCQAVAVLLEGRPLVRPELTARLEPLVAELRPLLGGDGDQGPPRGSLGLPWFDPRPAGGTAPLVAERIEHAAALFAAHVGETAEQLALRVGPLRAAWEAVGPGLWRLLAAASPDLQLPSRARLLVVHPVSGGGGRPLVGQGAVVLEGVLAHPCPRLPEPLRLALLLLQLAEPAAGYRPDADDLAGRVLAAGEQLQLVQPAADLADLARQTWLG